MSSSDMDSEEYAYKNPIHSQHFQMNSKSEKAFCFRFRHGVITRNGSAESVEALSGKYRDYLEKEVASDLAVVAAALHRSKHRVVITDGKLKHLMINDVLLAIIRQSTIQFDGVSNILSIDLRNNRIKGPLDCNILAGFTKLECLLLVGNRIEGLDLDENQWNVLPRSLERIDSVENPKFKNSFSEIVSMITTAMWFLSISLSALFTGFSFVVAFL